MTDGERDVIREQERDARETEEGGEWVRCCACDGTGYDLFSLSPGSGEICPECLGLGSWRDF